MPDLRQTTEGSLVEVLAEHEGEGRMTAKKNVTVTDWLVWVEAEALVGGWLSIRPTTKPGNRTGAPDVILAHSGDIVAVWVRPGEEGLTRAQQDWARAMLGEDAPSAERPVVTWGVDSPGMTSRSFQGVLVHPTIEGRDLIRGLLI